jgi:hypothetical protein
MPSKTYTVRINDSAPEITSEQVAAWLDAQLASSAPLVADPGAGEKTLRLSLDVERVKQLALGADESEAAALRRLIASNITIPASEPEPEPLRPKGTILKGALKLRAEQVRPLVSLVDAGQSFLIRKAFQLPPTSEALAAAAYTEEQKTRLAEASVELFNRRAPRVLVENIDWVGFASTFLAIEGEKIERVKAVAEHYRALAQQNGQPATESSPAMAEGGVQ